MRACAGKEPCWTPRPAWLEILSQQPSRGEPGARPAKRTLPPKWTDRATETSPPVASASDRCQPPPRACREIRGWPPLPVLPAHLPGRPGERRHVLPENAGRGTRGSGPPCLEERAGDGPDKGCQDVS